MNKESEDQGVVLVEVSEINVDFEFFLHNLESVFEGNL